MGVSGLPGGGQHSGLVPGGRKADEAPWFMNRGTGAVGGVREGGWSVSMTDEGFTAPQVTRLTGCTASQLRYWDKVRLVQPSVQKTHGCPGRSRLYSFQDMVVLRALKGMRDEGMSLQRIRRAWGYLREHGVLATASNGPLVVEGLPALKQFTLSDELLESLKDGQLMFFDLLDTGVQKVEDDPTRWALDRERFLECVRASRSSAEREAVAV